MDYKKVREIRERIKGNKEKLRNEEVYRERQKLRLNIQIDELKEKLERLKD
jgi:predicted  nucleic acid-binding Zn-ribbon protein